MTTIVTGGTRGIGAAITRALIRQGHTVVASYVRDHRAARAFEDELDGLTVVRADVTTGRGRDVLFDTATRLGPLTGLVNNAGATRHIGPLATTVPTGWPAGCRWDAPASPRTSVASSRGCSDPRRRT